MQTRQQSLIEPIINTGCAFAISYVVALFIFPIFFPDQPTAVKAFWITVIFTAISVALNYILRRVFNGFLTRRLTKEVEKAVIDTVPVIDDSPLKRRLRRLSIRPPWKPYTQGNPETFPKTETADNGQLWVLEIQCEDGTRFLYHDRFSFKKGRWQHDHGKDGFTVAAYIDPIVLMRKVI